MLYGLIHYNAPGETIEEFLDYAAEAGFDAVELQWRDVWPEEGEPEAEAERVRELLEARKLKCSTFAAGNDFNVWEDEQVQAQVERFERICRLADILGAPVIRTEGGQPKDEIPDALWSTCIAGCVLQCLEFVEEQGIILAIDNHGYITNNVDVLLDILETVDSPLVGTNLDTMNYRWYGYPVETLANIYYRVAPWVKNTHFKDGTGSRTEYKGCALGEGEVPLEAAVGALKTAGYQGVWCAEYEGPRDTSAEGYKQCLAWMKEHC
ncbi:MAG: sugar phosphate isomerase/epimerase [Armatimonadetes bacterium]|nr:sugar phosphate isomerase/epimerase [Armatimonadota bacterium]